MQKKVVLGIFICFFISGQIWAQDFGFGFSDEAGTSSDLGSSNPISVLISGEVSTAVIGYLNEIYDGPEHINTRDMFMFSGNLNFSARSSFAEGVINLKLVPALVPVSIDEAYIRAFFGNLDITAGLRKVSWGKADQFGPLDIINLPDQSRIFIEMADNNNLNSVRIANPVIHASYRFGQFSKIEGIFLPSYEIVSMAVSTAVNPNPLMALITSPVSERWIPEQMRMLREAVRGNSDLIIMPDTSGLDYAQAGLRFTTTLGSADIGMQYFFGRMFQPAVRVSYNPAYDPLNPASLPIESVEFLFNKYHQIGIDYAQVLAGFNIRAEVAANITEDIEGNDGNIYNPSIGWSFGFDRDIFAGLNINLQANGSIRLLNDRIGSDNPFDPNFDIEGGTSMTATRLTAIFSRRFLRDELELRTAVVWGIEDMDFAIIPAVVWTREDLRVAFSGGFFFGNSDGQIGQYSDNHFLKISVAYMF